MKPWILPVVCAAAAGVATYILMMRLKPRLDSWSPLGLKLTFKKRPMPPTTLASMMAIVVFCALLYSLQSLSGAPGQMQLSKTVALLEKELQIKNTQIEFLQDLVTHGGVVPSDRARQLAAEIPGNAAPYALGLKAIAESRFDDARKLLREAMEDREANLAKVYSALGWVELYAGRYPESAEHYLKALRFSPDDSILLANRGTALQYAGRYDDAEPLLKRALKIRERALGPYHPDVATCLNNLGSLYHTEARYRDAEPLYKRALRIWEKALGPYHPDVAACLNNLGELYSRQGRYEAAELSLRRALSIVEKSPEPDLRNLALSLSNLGSFYREQDRYPDAEPLLERALRIQEKALGQDHPEVAVNITGLGALYYEQGRYEDAELLLRRALRIQEKALGPDHPDVAICLNGLGMVYNEEASSLSMK